MEENEQQAVEQPAAGEAAAEVQNINVGEGKALIGKQVTKDLSLGDIKDFDPETKLYQISYTNGNTEKLTWSELKAFLPQEIKRIPRKKNNTGGSGEAKEQAIQGDEAKSKEQDVPGNETATEEKLPEPVGTSNIEEKQDEEQEQDHENATEPDEPEDNMVEDKVDEGADGGGDTDSSLDRELLAQKKRKKRRAHVLTLQKYKGKKKKLKVEEKATTAATDDTGEAEVEEAMPRLESRVKKLSEVNANAAAKLQKLKENAKVLKNILKQTSPLDNTEQGSPRAITKSKDISLLLEKTPAVDKPKDVASILESKPSPFDRGIKLRGRKLKKKFNGKLRRGEVADYDRRTRYYKIFYEDGDEEKLMWKDVEPLLATFDEMGRWNNPDDADKSEDKKKKATRKRQKK